MYNAPMTLKKKYIAGRNNGSVQGFNRLNTDSTSDAGTDFVKLFDTPEEAIQAYIAMYCNEPTLVYEIVPMNIVETKTIKLVPAL